MIAKVHRHRLGLVRSLVKDAQKHVDYLIMSEPTGTEREAMTEANIHLLEAINKLKELDS